mmetsp:Transcript_31719/g.40706  ORF Transcript_31719/g.40706 Transcript_31719/m.40706 type:complete len:194 (+) Transcript_31719:63-644(+)
MKNIQAWIHLLEKNGFLLSPTKFMKRVTQTQSSVWAPSAILGLDVGELKVGVAVSDETHSIASPMRKLIRKRPIYGPGSIISFSVQLKQIIAEANAAGVVVGWPLLTSGNTGIQCEKVLAFLTGIYQQRMINVPFTLWDERYTSTEARNFLWDSKLSKRKRAAKEDAMAAALILQEFLDNSDQVCSDCVEGDL